MYLFSLAKNGTRVVILLTLQITQDSFLLQCSLLNFRKSTNIRMIHDVNKYNSKSSFCMTDGLGRVIYKENIA